ncbi:MAG TPA: substrate-binding domain-containing protein [Armatimonadota bacterium]|nr:substrate-binding domain-containing protein [Armatimonadota bacterium]
MKIGALLLSAMTALALVGCGKEDGATTAAPGGGAGTGAAASKAGAQPRQALTQADLDGVTKASRPYRIAMIVKTRNNPFFDPMIKAAEAEAKALGVELEVQAPQQETDKERQFALVQDLTARPLDALLITPADSKGIVPALKQAEAKGVQIINLDNRIDTESLHQAKFDIAAYVGADNAEGGRLAGQAMVDALGSGKVAILEGIKDADNAKARKRGFTEGIQGKLEIVASDTGEWDTQKAYAKFQSMLAAHPEIEGLFCANDKMALGALKAISEAGKSGKITVIGYDNIPDVRPHLQSGALHGTVEQHPDLMGKYGVRAAVGVLDKTIAPWREFLVPLEVVKGEQKTARR